MEKLVGGVRMPELTSIILGGIKASSFSPNLSKSFSICERSSLEVQNSNSLNPSFSLMNKRFLAKVCSLWSKVSNKDNWQISLTSDCPAN